MAHSQGLAEQGQYCEEFVRATYGCIEVGDREGWHGVSEI